MSVKIAITKLRYLRPSCGYSPKIDDLALEDARSLFILSQFRRQVGGILTELDGDGKRKLSRRRKPLDLPFRRMRRRTLGRAFAGYSASETRKRRWEPSTRCWRSA